MTPRKLIASLALALPLLAGGQVPATITSDIPRMFEFVFTEAQWATENGYSAEQVAQLVAAARTARDQYVSLTGDRDLTGKFSASFAEQTFLPTTYAEMQNPRGGQYGQRMSANETANAILTEAIMSALPTGMRSVLQRARMAVSMQSTVGTTRYEQATSRDADLRRYFDRAAACADLKCSADTGNAIGAKGLFMQNEILKGQALDQAMRAERAAAELREREAFMNSIGSVRSRTIVAHEEQ